MYYCFGLFRFFNTPEFSTAMIYFHSLTLMLFREELDLSLRFLVISLPYELLGAISLLPGVFYGLWS